MPHLEAQQSVTKLIVTVAAKLVILKAAGKHEPLFNKPASVCLKKY
jgi:hypothetical protein